MILEIRGLVKQYSALRPLRLQELTIDRGDIVAIAGVDAPAAEMLSTLITGASLPDEGELRLFEQSTREIADTSAWLALLDGVGLISERVILLDQFTVRQNLAVPFTLDLEDLSEADRTSADRLADLSGLSDAVEQRVGDASPVVRARLRVGRALALKPALLLGEHPSATLPRDAVTAYAEALAAAARQTQTAVVMLTNDDQLARGLGGDIRTLDPATGSWRPRRLWDRLSRGLRA